MIAFLRKTLGVYRFACRKAAEFWRDWREDARLGIETAAFDGGIPKDASRGRFRDQLPYDPTPFRTIAAVIERLRPGSHDVVVDLGCGAGRVLCSFAVRGIKAIGLEIVPEYADKARENAKRLKVDHAPIEIAVLDAAEAALPDEATIFFLFHPFGFRTLHAAVERIAASLARRPRAVTIAYFNPVHRWYLDDRPWLTVDESLEAYEVMIWRSRG